MDKTSLIENLSEYLNGASEDVISLLVDLACKNVLQKRYPFGCAVECEETIVDEYSNVIFNAVVYAYEKKGISSHKLLNDNGTSRSFIDESSLYADVIPICDFV